MDPCDLPPKWTRMRVRERENKNTCLCFVQLASMLPQLPLPATQVHCAWGPCFLSPVPAAPEADLQLFGYKESPRQELLNCVISTDVRRLQRVGIGHS